MHMFLPVLGRILRHSTWPVCLICYSSNVVGCLCSVFPTQGKETENPRYSEKREGCHSGEFHLHHLPNVLNVSVDTQNPSAIPFY